MQRQLFLATGLLVVVMGVVYGVPARPLYEPTPPPKAPPLPAALSLNLHGTAWLGKYNSINRIFIFEGDGTLSYKSSAATSTVFKQRGRWWMNGPTLHFEHNIGVNKVMDFHGTITSANTITGESITKTGARSKQTLQRTTIAPKK